MLEILSDGGAQPLGAGSRTFVEGRADNLAQVNDQVEDLRRWDLTDDLLGFGPDEGDHDLAGELLEAEAGLQGAG